MTPGKYYSFSYKATNVIGDSTLSPLLSIPVADQPSKPTAVALLDHSYSTISVSWSKSANTQGTLGVITGYHLYMDNGYHEDFALVFNGEGLPDVRSFVAAGLVSGRPYRFYVQALNYAGISEASDITTIYACADPGQISAPKLNGQVTSTTIPIKWTAPNGNGGCAVTSFTILRDGGPSSPNFVEIHTSEVED